MDWSTPYHDLEKKEQSPALSFLLLHLLKAGGSHAKVADETTALDQEVNVYLAHLLLSIANPQHIEQTTPFISTNDLDVASMITETSDLASKYKIYKLNADHLLTLTGVFLDTHAEKDWLGSVSRDTLIGRGKTYYGFAAVYVKQIHRKVTAVMEVLAKLSEDFEKYTSILQDLSRAYFHLMQNISPKEMKEFMEQVSRIEKQIKLKELQDEFLDLYSQWLKNRDPELLKQVESLAQHIKQHDPAFKFTMPDHA